MTGSSGEPSRPAGLNEEQLAILERAIRELHWCQNTPRERDAAEGVVEAARLVGIIR